VIGGLVAIVVVSWTASGVLAALVIGVGAIVGAVLRLRGLQPSTAAAAARVAAMTERRD
jgi:hypothetical protein